jgi:hypothetical protein
MFLTAARREIEEREQKLGGDEIKAIIRRDG